MAALRLPGDEGVRSVGNDANTSIGSAVHGTKAVGMMSSVQAMSVLGKIRCRRDDAESVPQVE